MNIPVRSICMVALMVATSTAYADGHISININPFGWGAPPPVVYAYPREYGPPPMVYYGGGRWGDDRGVRDRGRGGPRGRPNQRGNDGHRR